MRTQGCLLAHSTPVLLLGPGCRPMAAELSAALSLQRSRANASQVAAPQALMALGSWMSLAANACVSALTCVTRLALPPPSDPIMRRYLLRDGQGLLEYATRQGWPATAAAMLEGLMDVACGVPYHVAAAGANPEGHTLL